MMERQYDWSPLGESRDPIPGSPDQVRQAAQHYRAISSQLADAAGSIRSVTFEGEGETIQVLRTRTQELSKNLDGVRDLCRNASHALEGYSGALGEAQDLSVKALRMAEQARHEYQVQSMNREDVRQRYNNSKDEHERANLQHSFYAYDTQMKQASDSIKAAKQLLNQAIEHRDAAADSTSRALDALMDESPVKDGIGDYFFKALEIFDPLVEFLRDATNSMSWILAGAALVCDAISLLCPVAAEVTVPLSLAFQYASTGYAVLSAGFSLLHNLHEMHEGRKSPLDVYAEWKIDEMSIAIGLIPFAGPVGKVAKPLVKGAGKKLVSKGLGAAAKSGAKTVGKTAVTRAGEAMVRKPEEVGEWLFETVRYASGIDEAASDKAKKWLAHGEDKPWWQYTAPYKIFDLQNKAMTFQLKAAQGLYNAATGRGKHQ